MRLENWSVGTRPQHPYQAPELSPCLQGIVYGHPTIEDGKHITTSIIAYVSGESVLTKSGSEYVLGAVDPAYELAFPNARARLFEQEYKK